MTASSSQLPASGFQLPASGYRLPAFRSDENWKRVAGGGLLGAGSWKREAGSVNG